MPRRSTPRRPVSDPAAARVVGGLVEQSGAAAHPGGSRTELTRNVPPLIAVLTRPLERFMQEADMGALPPVAQPFLTLVKGIPVRPSW